MEKNQYKSFQCILLNYILYGLFVNRKYNFKHFWLNFISIKIFVIHIKYINSYTNKISKHVQKLLKRVVKIVWWYFYAIISVIFIWFMKWWIWLNIKGVVLRKSMKIYLFIFHFIHKCIQIDFHYSIDKNYKIKIC